MVLEGIAVDMERRARRIEALYIVGVGGLISVGLDAVDHPLALIFKGIPITWENLARKAGRPLHLPMVLISGTIFIVLGALCCGFLLDEMSGTHA